MASNAPTGPYCLRPKLEEQVKRLGHDHAQSFRRNQKTCQSLANTWWGKLLALPCLLYDAVVYKPRPDVLQHKTGKLEWRALQSDSRFLNAVLCYIGPPSHILHHIKWPLLVDMCVGALVVVDQVLQVRGGPNILPNVGAEVITTWRLISFVMSLLMAFRINRCYDRWWQARQSVDAVGSSCFILTQQTATWFQDEAVKAEIIRWCTIWVFALKQLCSGQDLLDPAAAAMMSADELHLYHASGAGHELVTLRLRQLIQTGASKLCTARRGQLESTLNQGIANMDACLRILEQAMPYSITLMCTGFVQIFLLLLPIGVIAIVDGSSTADHPAIGLVIYFLTVVLLLGVDEVASQLEQPFPHIPLDELCNSSCESIARTARHYAQLQQLGDAAVAQWQLTLGSVSHEKLDADSNGDQQRQ